MQNFFLRDVAECALVILIFPLILVFPGYLLAWLCNLFGFRRKSIVVRLTVSVPFSIALAGVVATLLARRASLWAALVFFSLLSIAAVGLIVWEILDSKRRKVLAPGHHAKVLVAVSIGWMLLTIAALVDVQVGNRLYLSVTTYDNCVRASFARSIVHTGIPPANPFYFPGQIVHLRYYYFWNALAAMPSLLSGVDARLTMYASTFWCGLGLIAIVALYLKYFSDHSENLFRKALIGAGLLTVTGLDLIPAFLKWVFPPHFVDADLEWWSWDIVTGWIDSLLWVPNHVASLIACLFGFLLIYLIEEEESSGKRLVYALLAGFAFASSAGYSVYVTFTFAIFMLLWACLTLVKRRYAELGLQALAGAVSLVLSLPYLRELQAPASGFAFAAFKVHRFPDIALTLYQLGFNVVPYLEYVNFILLPINYLLEFGLLFFVVILRWRVDRPYRWRELSRSRQASWLMLAVGLFVTSFLRSQIINANDLAYRAALLTQYIALLWAVPLVESGFSTEQLKNLVADHRRRVLEYSPRFLKGILILGVVGSAYQVVMLRVCPVLADAGLIHTVYDDKAGSIGRANYEFRTALETLDRVLPSRSTVQPNPNGNKYIPRLLYQQRQEVAAFAGCGAAFGGDPFQCMPIWSRLYQLFNRPKRADSAELDLLCKNYSINYLIVNGDDRVWKDINSWVWKRPTVYSSDFIRVLPCGVPTRQTSPAP